MSGGNMTALLKLPEEGYIKKKGQELFSVILEYRTLSNRLTTGKQILTE